MGAGPHTSEWTTSKAHNLLLKQQGNLVRQCLASSQVPQRKSEAWISHSINKEIQNVVEYVSWISIPLPTALEPNACGQRSIVLQTEFCGYGFDPDSFLMH